MRMDRLEQLIEKLERQNKSEIVDAIVREGQPIPPGARRPLIIVERIVAAKDEGLSEHGTVPFAKSGA
jgi:hypothetical protein